MKAKVIELPRKPVYRRFETTKDFFDIFKIVEKNYDTCYLLESLGEENYDSRYSVMGFSPDSIYRSMHGKLLIDDQEFECENPYYELRRIFPQDVLSRNYAGGLVGNISYDAMTLFEPTLAINKHEDFPQFELGLYTDGLVLDKMTGEIYYFHFIKDRIKEIQKLVNETDVSSIVTKTEVKNLGHSKSKDDHKEMVDLAIEEIKAGNTFQCQIGFRVNYEIKGDTLPIYEALRRVNPSPYMFYVKFKERKVIGASPELIFRLRQGEMETFPLAGTTKRGSTPSEDDRLRRTLLSDPKEIAEHNMLVDLHRNDLGRVARFGTVKVRRLFDIKRFSHVQHISSEVVGIIRHEDDMFTGLASVFPAGTLSGAPKIESMKIINKIEKDARGIYGGAVGHFGFNGNCTFAIPIRTLFVNGTNAFARASGGIVYDSVAENEYQEIINKLGAITKTMAEFIKE